MVHENLKAYVGTKVILARPMTNVEFKKEKGEALNEPPKEGYRVEYPDLYVSWSPKETFENAYRLVSKDEISMIVDQYYHTPIE
jgi:hypothetical protein